VRRIIPVESDLISKFVYDLSYIAAGKNFTMGGFFDETNKMFVIDKKDLSNIVPKTKDHIEFQGERFEISKISKFDDNAGYIFITQRMQTDNAS